MVEGQPVYFKRRGVEAFSAIYLYQFIKAIAAQFSF